MNHRGLSQSQNNFTSGNITKNDCDKNPLPIRCFPWFNARLNGSSEVPPVDTKATGKALITPAKNGTSFLYSINLTDITPTAVDIHQGKVGENGPIVVSLYKSGIVPCCVPGTITNEMLEGPLKDKGLGALSDLITTEQAYLDVHTGQHPDGEIRGQVYHITVQFPKP